ncbi:right-handed parallel beta-helix repeat-containing protein [Planococcus sp. ISL-110]|uniref:right-handed parallel beta-helix repeat-containing protein n=1 Tax=Planococcus sp. ISL-110 TaxID=2819167 RepID=UPI001BE72131|nr:right-handed parallel beta-helix repeat-containing protein [Planococcus sp. ISL-110]MBT2571158.1 right-handed parallel beta-helix repeat-containing protein [Planococcus sp. ISL-110]
MLLFLCIALFALTFQAFAHKPQEGTPKPYIHTGEESTLQKLIDATESGGTLVLDKRAYQGSFSISKPITIKGVEGTSIVSLETALEISNTKNVVIEDIELKAEEAGIVATGIHKLTLKNIKVEQGTAGIEISNSTDITLDNVDISGQAGHFATKGHAIAIYKSVNVQASESDISNVLDGFYIERTDDVSLTDNRIQDSRYAIHMMYSDKVRLDFNDVRANLTGLMIMVANDVSITNNSVKKNNTLNSVGIYTYDVNKMVFSDNELSENTVAMDIQDTRNMVIKSNFFSTNGTVIQAKYSGSVSIQDNEFHGNILTARTDEEGVLLQHNFYDDYTGKDYDGDGIGDTNYIATNSFGQWMVRKPVYQYFIESPSVATLNKMDTEVTDHNSLAIIDDQPIVMGKTFNTNFSINGWQFIGSIFVLIAMFIVRRKLI